MHTVLKTRSPKYRKAVAIAVSLGMHVLVFCLLLVSTHANLANATLEGDGVAEMEGIQLNLVGLHDSTRALAQAYQPPSPQTSRMDSFMQMTEASQTLATTEFDRPNPAKSISEALGENPFEPQTSAPESKTSTEAHIKTNNNRTNTTPNDLWKAIAPCWNRIADKTTMPVVLEVSFSPLGNLSKPPSIMRNGTQKIDDRMLRSESQAISALAQCGPYLMAFGQDNVQVSFPKPL